VAHHRVAHAVAVGLDQGLEAIQIEAEHAEVLHRLCGPRVMRQGAMQGPLETQPIEQAGGGVVCAGFLQGLLRLLQRLAQLLVLALGALVLPGAQVGHEQQHQHRARQHEFE